MQKKEKFVKIRENQFDEFLTDNEDFVKIQFDEFLTDNMTDNEKFVKLLTQNYIQNFWTKIIFLTFYELRHIYQLENDMTVVAERLSSSRKAEY